MKNGSSLVDFGWLRVGSIESSAGNVHDTVFVVFNVVDFAIKCPASDVHCGIISGLSGLSRWVIPTVGDNTGIVSWSIESATGDSSGI